MVQTLSDASRPAPAEDLTPLGCLQQALTEGSEPERCLAAQGLGWFGGRNAAEALIDAVRDPDPDVRAEVALALARAGNGAATGPLLDNLRDDPVGEVKSVYISTLKTLGAREAFDLICSLVTGRGEDFEVQWEDDFSGWDDWLDVQLAAIESLGTIAPEPDRETAASRIVTALQDPDGQDLWAPACRALAELGGPGIDTLETLAANASPLNRKRIAASLRHAVREDAEPLLLRLVQDQDISVRLAAIEVAGDVNLQQVSERALEDVAPEVRAAAFEGFNDLSVKALASGLNDINPKVRIAACRAVERIGQKIPGLGITRRVERLIRTGDASVIAAMVSAAATSEPHEAAELIEDIVNNPGTANNVRLACLREVGRLTCATTPDLLVRGARDKRQDIRLAALVALGQLADGTGPHADEAARILISALDGTLVPAPAGWEPEEPTIPMETGRKNKQARGQDAEARTQLDRNGNIVEAKNAVQEETPLEAPEDSAPLSTLDAILNAGPQQDLPSDEVGIKIDEEDLPYLARTAAQITKRRISPESTVAPHLDVPRIAARVIASLPYGTFVKALAAASDGNDKELVIAALDALGAYADLGIRLNAAEQILMQHCVSPDPELRYRGVRALGAVDTEAAQKAVSTALSDADGAVRTAALNGLSEDQARDELVAEHCQDPDRRARRAAAHRLAADKSTSALPHLMEYALKEDAVQSRDGACLLTQLGSTGLQAMAELARSDAAKSRLTGLTMLAHALEHVSVSSAGKG